jgi:hypothetical protein
MVVEGAKEKDSGLQMEEFKKRYHGKTGEF